MLMVNVTYIINVGKDVIINIKTQIERFQLSIKTL